jgi:hypothetical protein
MNMFDGGADFLGRLNTADGTPIATTFNFAPFLWCTALHAVQAIENPTGDTHNSRITLDHLRSTGRRPLQAELLAADSLSDLAILYCAKSPEPPPITFAASDSMTLGTPVLITGHAVLEDPGRRLRYVDALGTWSGTAMREDKLLLARISSKDVLPGMSGAPVLRVSDRAIVGMVSERYNSRDG